MHLPASIRDVRLTHVPVGLCHMARGWTNSSALSRPCAPYRRREHATTLRAARNQRISLCLRLVRLRWHDRVLRSLGHPELHSLLGCDFDGFTCGRIAAHPCLAINTDQSPDSREDEQAVLLDLRDCRLGECVQQLLRYLLRDLALVCEGLDDLRLCHCDFSRVGLCR